MTYHTDFYINCIGPPNLVKGQYFPYFFNNETFRRCISIGESPSINEGSRLLRKPLRARRSFGFSSKIENEISIQKSIRDDQKHDQFIGSAYVIILQDFWRLDHTSRTNGE